MTPDARPTIFLNVDLDLRCAAGLDDLLAAFAADTIVLNRADDFASLEAVTDSSTLDAAVTRLLDVIAALPPAAQALWRACETRTFNIGLRAGVSPGGMIFDLPAGTVQRLAAAGAGIAITVYA